MRSLPRALAFAPRAALLCAGLNLAIVTCPALAFAAGGSGPAASGGVGATAGDAIYLKNGGILRGTIVDAIPNDHARIELATHEIATVAWSDIARIEHAGESRTVTTAPPSPAPASPGPPTSTPAAPGTLPADKSLVTVHIEGPDDAELEQDTTGNDDWASVCTSPCDRALSTAYWYRIAGGGMKASSQFSLRGKPGSRVTITVSPASKGWFIAGLVAIPVGGIVAYIGLVIGIVGSVGQNVSSSTGDNTGSQTSGGVAATGWTMLAVGGIAAVGGIVLMVSNWKTGVSQNISGDKAASQSDAALRLASPVWREPTAEQKVLPPAWAIPVVSGQF